MVISRPEIGLIVCGIFLILLTAIGLTLPQPIIGQFGIGYGKALDHFVVLVCLQGLIYFVSVIIILRGRISAWTIWLILGCAILLRLILVIFPPFLSNDIYRYIWDGWVQAAGINPYRYIPDDSHLAFLRDTIVFPNINRASYAHTIYPPAAEIIFLIASSIGHLLAIPPVLNMKLMMLVLEGIGVWAIMQLLDLAGLPRTRILIYVWNPIPIWEFAGSGHVDAIEICFVSLALLAACCGKYQWSAVSFAAAVLTKFLPLVLFPALWRRWDWKYVVSFMTLILLLYSPYIGIGKAVLGFLGGYSAQEGIDSGRGIFLLSALGEAVHLPVFSAAIYLMGLAIFLLALGAAMLLNQPPSLSSETQTKMIAHRSLLLGCVLMVGVSPHYPWYYCWLLIPACLIPWSSVIYLVTATTLLYLNPTHRKLFWPAFVYLPFFVLAIRDRRISRAGLATTSIKFAEGDNR